MSIYVTLQQIDEAADAVRARTKYQPKVGIILGSGLNGLAEQIRCWPMRPNDPRWPWGVCQAGDLGFSSLPESLGPTVAR